MVKEIYQRIILDNSGSITFQPVINGVEVNVDSDSASITIVDSSDNDLPTAVTSDVVTIATDDKLSFTVIAANTDEEGLYKATWKYQVNSVEHVHDSFYRVVKSIADQLVSKRDVVLEIPRLSGIDFEDVTWEDFIDHQWNFVENDLRNRGIYSFLILRAEDLYFVHLYYVCSMAASNFMEEEDSEDYWNAKHKQYFSRYKDQLNKARLAYDTDNSGNLSEDENVITTNSIKLSR